MILLKKDEKIIIQFQKDDLEILTRVIGIPLGAFGLEELIQKTNISKEKIVALNDYLKNILLSEKLEGEFFKQEFQSLIDIFTVSCDIADPIEIHTLTGYTWEQAQNLLSELKNNV